jgi:hypothetical protein
MSLDFMRWLWLNLCSATADLSGGPSRTRRRWSFIPAYRDQPVCPMYTWPHSQGMLCTLGVLRPRSSITGRRELEICLGGSPTHLILCLANILLSRPYVVWTNGRRANEVGLSVGLEVLTVGLRAQLICFILLQSFSLKVVFRNSNSSWRLSLSHKDLAVCDKADGKVSMLDRWWCDSECR